MSVEWFDLAQRLCGARTGDPVPRLAHATFTPSAVALAVRAVARGRTVTVTVAAAGGTDSSADDAEGLRLLAALGGTIAAPVPVQLITDRPATVGVLLGLARGCAHDSDAHVSGAAALVNWWADRADHPGTGAVIELVAASSARFVLGTDPVAQRSAQVWRRWLGVGDESVAGLHEWAARVGGGALLPLLTSIHEDDSYTFGLAQASFVDGYDWTRPDNPARAAMGLRGRCDAADVYSAALLGDPLWRRRAVHTGHVAIGTASVTAPVAGSRRRNPSVAVTCERIDSRLRAGTAVTGWSGGVGSAPFERFFTTVHSAQVHGGRLVLGLDSFGSHVPAPGASVVVMPQPPDMGTLRSGRRRYRRLFAARRSWLSTGQTPVPQRRDVPLDVLIAGAED